MDARAGGAPLTRAVDVSVVVPSRNEAGTIVACLDALRHQDCDPARYEVLVVDGGSTDGTTDLVRKAGVRLLTDGRGGPSGARNVGILEARGAIVAFTDADCIPAHDWVSSILRVFEERPSLAGVGGALRSPRATLLGTLEDAQCQVFYRGFITSNVAYRAHVLDELGGFDERLDCGEDWDLAWRAQDAGHELTYDPRPVVTHDPPELRGSPWRFLGKQAWYGRHDVPTYAAAFRRALRDSAAAGSRHAFLEAREAIGGLACVATMAVGTIVRSPRLAALGLGAAALSGSRQALLARRAGALSARHVPAAAALQTARLFARGVGTLTGCLDVARAAVRAPRIPAAPPAPGALPTRAPGAGAEAS